MILQYLLRFGRAEAIKNSQPVSLARRQRNGVSQPLRSFFVKIANCPRIDWFCSEVVGGGVGQIKAHIKAGRGYFYQGHGRLLIVERRGWRNVDFSPNFSTAYLHSSRHMAGCYAAGAAGRGVLL